MIIKAVLLKKDLRKQKRNKKLKGVEEGIIKEDVFKRKILSTSGVWRIIACS